MRTSLAVSIVVSATAAWLCLGCGHARRAALGPSPAADGRGSAMLDRLPVAFVPNLGQWDHAARFVARLGAMTVFLEEHGWTFTLRERTGTPPARGVAVRMTFVGAGTPELVAEEPLPGHHHYFLGNDPARWRSDVPLHRAVRYREVQPGVDVRAHEQDSHFEYDLVLQPRAGLEPVEIMVAGIERMHVDSESALVLETRLGPVRMPAPLTWEEGPAGERSPVSCRYVVRGNDRFGFEVTGRRPGWTLVVDPGLVWSTFLGGAGDDGVEAVALDADGGAVLAGGTSSADFPTTPGAFDVSHGGTTDAFVARLSPAGSTLVWSTFLGGANDDAARSLALDRHGIVTVAGLTLSHDFPATPGAFDPSYGGQGDGFVTRLSPAGSSLVWSTFFGGTDYDTAQALAVDAQGAVSVCGYTLSADFPTTSGAFDTTFNTLPRYDAFVTRFAPTGSSLVYSTFLGGRGNDWAYALVLDAQGVTTVAGETQSDDFPTTAGAFDTSFNGRSDAFVVRLAPAGSQLVWSTFLGSTDSDWARAIATDGQGAFAIAGGTGSTGFPTTPGAFDRTHNGNYDAFVAMLSPSGARLDYSTLLGGLGTDWANAIALDAQGTTTVVGRASSADFPITPGAFDSTFDGSDAFVVRFSPAASRLIYSTFLGGVGFDVAGPLALDAQGAATVAGASESVDFPTTPGAFDTTHNGGQYDAFVTRLDLLPTGVAALGRSSPGCTGPLAISVTSMPRIGNASFAVTCGNAPPNAMGLLAFTDRRVAGPVPVLGVEAWIDLGSPFVPVAASSTSIGAAEVSMQIPNDQALVGLRLFAQFFWRGPTAPPPCPPLGLSASNALDITIQP